eukprot:TRINITY_DN10057_c0_g1_i2.p1 TRINITY_DN10057_c0_g1~~TRINITY_DN10057_c0_g1_i2.p1  ORF type:complete len:735 (+),score=110.86 TRINITY_DN10057_c0_g1_i2:101-2305(+)
MSAFDEGRVTFSNYTRTVDQADEYDTQQAVAPDKAAAFKQYLKQFPMSASRRRSSIPYLASHQMDADNALIQVDYSQLTQQAPKLGQCLQQAPAEFLSMMERVATEVWKEQRLLNDENQEVPQVQVLVTSSEAFHPYSIRDLTSEHVSKLVMIPGIITAVAKPKNKATHMNIMCKDCGDSKIIPIRSGMGGTLIPRSCESSANVNNMQKCSLDPYVTIPDRCKFIDQQTAKLQERPEDIPTGDLPRSIMVLMERKLCDQVVPGTRTTVIGIFSNYQAKGPKDKHGNVALMQPYIKVIGFQGDDDTHARLGKTIFSDHEVGRFQEFARQPNVHKEIFNQIAPQIYGSDNIKKAIACLLFGGSRKALPDGTKRRGDINVLLLGDPSTAKSQLLKFTSQTAPVAVYTSGKGSSAAGLTASVMRDPQTHEFCLQGGAMVLADNGVVCIDEFDKMSPEDRVAIHEAMEQQTISIAKAGITTMLRSRTSILAAANPPSGRYDDLKTAEENIDLATTILSRFDLIFIVKDERNKERDQTIARHVLALHQQAGTIDASMQDDENQEGEFMKRYIQFARSSVQPVISEEAGEFLENEYVRIRSQFKQQRSDGSSGAIPITVRQLEAWVRISESLAKMALQTEVTIQHVQLAMELFNASTLDAIQSGLHQAANLTQDQKAELAQVEKQILQRVAVNSIITERRLVDSLIKIGLSEMLIQRCIVYMVHQRILEYKKDSKMLHRKR